MYIADSLSRMLYRSHTMSGLRETHRCFCVDFYQSCKSISDFTSLKVVSPASVIDQQDTHLVCELLIFCNSHNTCLQVSACTRNGRIYWFEKVINHKCVTCEIVEFIRQDYYLQPIFYSCMSRSTQNPILYNTYHYVVKQILKFNSCLL